MPGGGAGAGPRGWGFLLLPRTTQTCPGTSAPFHFARARGLLNVPRVISMSTAHVVSEMPPGKAAACATCEQRCWPLTRQPFVPSAHGGPPQEPPSLVFPAPPRRLTLDAHAPLAWLTQVAESGGRGKVLGQAARV